ncbi:MAG: D-tyrosyl-tRNA(Tyr) deacylase [Chlamydiales bacterium]|jgi:D-tyrosyl-tRNA(Tyr) deacylase
MKVVIQRVTRACVRVDDEIVGDIERGVLVLLGVMKGDGEAQALKLARDVATFRIFPEGERGMHLSTLDVGLAALVVSQFTLAADGRKGRRPSFDRAAAPEVARPLVDRFVGALRDLGVRVETGQFQASMQVELVNDGPVTFVLEAVAELSEGP